MLQEVSKAIEIGELGLIEGIVLDAIDAGDHPNAILLEDIIPAICVVGAKLQAEEIHIHQALASAKTMKKGVEVLKPYLTNPIIGKFGKYISGAAAGDIHEINRNTVRLMIEIAGLDVSALGVDVTAEEFANEIEANPNYEVDSTSAFPNGSIDAHKKRVLVTAGRRNLDRAWPIKSAILHSSAAVRI